MTSLLDDPMKNDSTTVKSAHSKGIASFLYAHRVDVEDPLRCILSTRLVIVVTGYALCTMRLHSTCSSSSLHDASARDDDIFLHFPLELLQNTVL